MLDREAILPLALGAIIALILHVGAIGSYARWHDDNAGADVAAPALADLVATARATSPVGPGEPVVIETLVENRGAIRASSFTTTLSIDGVPRIESRSVDLLPVSARVPAARTVRFDQPGVYTAIFTVDADQQVAEVDETNNTAAAAIIVQAPPSSAAQAALPDLAVFDIKLPDQPQVGLPVPLEINIANLGYVPVSRFELAITLEDKIIATADVDQLVPPGQNRTIPMNIQVDQPGAYKLCAIADPRHKVVELEENNNARCRRVVFHKTDPTRRPGQVEPEQPVNINLISHEEFEQIVAQLREDFDQPMVQMTADPMPVDRAPDDPTDPGLPDQAVAGGRPAQPSELSPAQAARQGTGQKTEPTPQPAAAVEVEQPTDEQPAALPNVEVARADEALTPDEVDKPVDAIEQKPTPTEGDTPRDVTDRTPKTNDTDAPRAPGDEADRVDLQDPPLDINQTGDDPLVPESVGDVPRTDDVVRDAPDVAPVPEADPADASQQIVGKEGDEPTDAAVPIDPKIDADRTTLPEQEPVEVAMADPKTAQPDTPVDPKKPSEPDTASGTQATQASPQTQPQPAPRLGQNARPTVEQRTDLEAPPVSRIIAATVKPGGTKTIQGVQIKTVEPRFSPVALGTAVPGNPEYRIRFDGNGKVIKVDTLKSSGWVNIDAPLLTAIYKWRAQGNIAEDGFVIESLTIRLTRD